MYKASAQWEAWAQLEFPGGMGKKMNQSRTKDPTYTNTDRIVRGRD